MKEANNNMKMKIMKEMTMKKKWRIMISEIIKYNEKKIKRK